jgi:hypothetical protein
MPAGCVGPGMLPESTGGKRLNHGDH